MQQIGHQQLPHLQKPRRFCKSNGTTGTQTAVRLACDAPSVLAPENAIPSVCAKLRRSPESS
ncbi:hypothetical protein Z949_2542 [Sulfitobacter guttiformis KCTC 32187]|nr:hypothetical protein Z949_2542 [Sulfitobacter guttiformis KCTC 32187]